MAQDPAGDYAVTDPPGDVRSGHAPEAPSLPAGSAGAYDLLRLRIHDEDEEALRFELQVGDLRAPATFIDGALLDYVFLVVSFQIDASGPRYELEWEVALPVLAPTNSGVRPAAARLCILLEDRPCTPQRVVAHVNWDDSTVGAWVPKDALSGRGPLPGTPPQARAPPFDVMGNQLFRLYAFSRPGASLQLADRLPDTGDAPDYVLRHPLAVPAMRLGFDDPEAYAGPYSVGVDGFAVLRFPVVPVAAGTPAPVRLRLENAASSPRIVNLTLRYLEEGPGSAWGLRLIETLTIPANSTRLANLITDPSKIPFETTQLVQIAAISVAGEPGATAHTFRLVSAAPPPGPARRELFLHAVAPTEIGAAFGQTCRIPFCDGPLGWMNTERDEARATGDDGIMLQYSNDFNSTELFAFHSVATFALDHPAPRDLVLDRRERATLRLQVRTAAPLEGELSAIVLAGGEETAIGSAAASWPGAGAHTVELGLPIVRPIDRIPKGGGMVLMVELDFDRPYAAAYASDPPLLVPGASSLELPFVADPLAVSEPIAAGPTVIGLATDDAVQDFVNPNGTALFNVTVVNEGILEDEIHLEADADDDAWTAEIVPASDFRLQPGESARVGLYVRPPAGVLDGDMARITFNASSEADESARASLRFEVTVTSGVEIADEAGLYRADPDTDLHAAPSGLKGTPGFEAPFAGAALAAAAIGLAWRPPRRLAPSR